MVRSWQLNRQKSESCFQLPTFKRLLERLAITPAQEKGCRILTTSENAILFRRTLVATAGKVSQLSLAQYDSGTLMEYLICLESHWAFWVHASEQSMLMEVSPYNIISAL